MTALLIGINAKYIHSNLAIRSLKAYAESQGCDWSIELMEYTINQPIGQLLDEIILREPDLVGFSCYIWNYSQVRSLCVELKKLLPNMRIVLGGPEVTFTPDITLMETNCDHVICGEGERAFAELLTSLSNRIIPASVIESGEPIPLSDIPFVYYNDTTVINRIIYYEASRGCPFNCQYCLSGGSRLRTQQLERVYADMSYFMSKNVPQVKYIDRTFNADRAFALDVWRWLSEYDNGVTNFHFEIAAELLTDYMLAFLQTTRKGLFQFEIGVQSTNPATLIAIKRRTDTDVLTRVVTALQLNHNIHLHLDLIAGLPHEDYAAFARSFNFVHSLAPDQLQLGFLKLLKGSGLYQNSTSYGLVHTTYPPYEVLRTDALSAREVIRLKDVETVVELYYNSNRYKATLNLLSGAFSTPFELFEALGDWYREGGHYNAAHSKIDLYDMLMDFAEQRVDSSLLYEAVRLDIFAHEKANKLPSRIVYSGEALELMRRLFSDTAFVEQYLPQYQGENPMRIMRIAHLDIFPASIVTQSGYPLTTVPVAGLDDDMTAVVWRY